MDSERRPEVTRRLGIEPTRTWRAGERRGETAKWPRDGWWLVVGPRETIDIDSLLQELREQINVPGPVVRQTCDELQLEAEITCGITQPEEATTPALTFPADFLAWTRISAASIGIDLILTA